MSANVQNLVRMANQIESFFRGEPDRDAAVAGIENHIRRFWEPRMRRLVVAHVEAGGTDLGEFAAAAIRKLSPGKPPAG